MGRFNNNKKNLLIAAAGIVIVFAVFSLFYFTFGNGTKKTSDNLGNSALGIEQQLDEKDKIIIANLLQLNAELTQKVNALEDAQKLYEKQSCTPIQILINAPPEIADYGISQFVSMGETELCGINMQIGLGSWGPSIKAYIEGLKQEVEYYKALSVVTQTQPQLQQ